MTEQTGPKRWAARLLSAAPRLGSRRFLVGAVVAAALAGILGGYGVSKLSISALASNAMTTVSRDWLHAPQRVEWERYDTMLGDFEYVRLTLFNGDDVPLAALEEMDGHLVFLTQRGALSDLNQENELNDLGLQAPMNTEALIAANLPKLNLAYFRALDLLAIETAPHAFDLYVSFDRYDAARRCFEIAVARVRMNVDAERVSPQSDWEHVYATTPCAPPRTGEAAFVGIQSGGRLVRYDADIILLSTGDLEFDGAPYPGVTDLINAPQDPAWDLGKIIAIHLPSGQAEHIASGLRNPQGLLVDRQGRIWETEHGPYGGDEINLIQRGADYGWPTVTYGMRYFPAGENWPLNPTHGGHEDFARPAYVFVPSIGVSQLIQPSAEEFPFWDNTLLVTSMRARNLYAARLDGDRIMYAEPLPLGERLRDIINRQNGEIAMVTDLGSLIRIRAPTESDDHGPIVIADTRQRPPPPRLTAAQAGARIFAANCQSCHTLSGRAASGPALQGVVGRDVAAEDFPYSAALRRTRGDWTRARLVEFLDAPEAFGETTMPDPRLDRAQAEQVVAYLRTLER